MQAAKRVALNTGFLYARMAISVFISLYSTRLILDALGATDFGIFNVVGGAILMLGFLNACMAEATQRFMSFAQGSGEGVKLKKIFNVSILLHLAIAVILFILLEIAGYFLFSYVLNIHPARLDAAKVVYQFMVLSTLFTVISVPYDAVINARENMFLFAVLGIVESVLKLMIAFCIVSASTDKLMLYGILLTTLSVLLLLARWIYCMRKYPECEIKMKSNYDGKLMKEMTSFAGWSFLGYSTSMVAFYGQGLVINVFFGTVVNAAHGIGNQISGQLGTLAHTMMRALNPMIAKSEGAGNRELMVRTAVVGSKISFFLLMLLYVPVLIEMPYILSRWLKEIPEFTIIFCRLLLIRNIIEQLFLTLTTSIAAVGNIRRFQLFGAVISCFPLIITYILFSVGYPPYTLYIIYIIYSLFASFNILYFSKKTFDLSISYFIRKVVVKCMGIFLIGLVVSSSPLFLMSEGIIRLISVSAISLLSFLPLVWYIGFSQEDRTGIKLIFFNLFDVLWIKVHNLKIRSIWKT